MARAINRLTARKVATLTTPGRHADGGGLYLVVDPSGARRWVFLYRKAGKRREMGLGPVLAVPLIQARELAATARAELAAGGDPIRARQKPPNSRVLFSDVAETFLADHEAGWRNEAHRRQWRQTLEDHGGVVWSSPVASVSTELVLACLRPIWTTMPETARRLRGRIERILDAAAAQGMRSGENPARWKGHLAAVLPRVAKLQRGHHPAMPYAELPGFFAELCDREAPAARALRFLILTVARSGEVRGMPGAELNPEATLWTVPAARMKGKRAHRVPLSTEARGLVAGHISAELVFPSSSGREMSDMVFGALLKRMGRGDVTAHGFRSSFRDWVHAETDFPGELAEEALAHQVGNETERAYRRSDAMVKRRHLMEAWARFVASAQSAA